MNDEGTYVEAETDPPFLVHVANWPQATEEVPPEHLVTQTFLNSANIQEVLQLNPLRVKATLSITGAGTVYLCHSQAEAVQAQGGFAGAGAQITNVAAAASIIVEMTSTAKLWAYITGAAVLSIMTESRTR